MSRSEFVACRTRVAAMLPDVLMVFILLGIIQASDLSIKADIQPKNPWFFVGHNMTVSCRLINLTSTENSSRMYFSFEGKNLSIPSEYVEVISASTIRLTYPVTKLLEHQYLGCFLNHTNGTLDGLDFTHIYSDYPPEKIKNISCVVDDWKTMTCSWDLDHTYSKHTKIQLWWKTRENRSTRCPEMKTNTCTWRENFAYDEDYKMYIKVSSRRPLKIVTEKSETFVIHSRTIVKPAPPDVDPQVLNQTCVQVKVKDREDDRKMVAVIQFQSQCDEDKSTWSQVNITAHDGTQDVICNLIPFTNYTVRVAVQSQPFGENHPVGFLSDWWNKTVLTQPSVPTVAPEMCNSCFSSLPCNADQCNQTVLVYWKAIPRCLRYTIIKGYHLSVLDGNQIVANYSIDGTQNSKILPFSSQQPQSYTIKLFAVTKEGNIASNYSKILLSPRHMITTPKNFVVETDTEYAEDWDSRVFYLRWSSAEAMVDNYTLVWCRGSKWRRKCDPDDEVHYEVLPGTASEYELKIPPGDVGRKPDDYMIGIASEVRQASSGIIWAPCFHIKDVVPPQVRDVTALPVKNNVDVSWLHRGCDFDYNDSRAYISNYSITYCTTVSGSICSGSEHKEVVDQLTTRHTLKNLKWGTKYMIQVTAFSQHGQGPPGKIEVEIPAYQDDTSANSYLVPIILPLICFTIIAFGVYLKRRWKKKSEKFVFQLPHPSFEFTSHGSVSKPYVSYLNKKNTPENTELVCLLDVEADSSNSDALDRVDHQLTQTSARPALRPPGQSGSISTDQAYNSMDYSSERDSAQYFKLDSATTTNRVELHKSRTHNPTVRHDAYVDPVVCRVQCTQDTFYNGTNNPQNNTSYPQLSAGNTTYVQAALPSLTQQKGAEFIMTGLPLPDTQSTSHSVSGSSSEMYVSREKLASNGDIRCLTSVSQNDASQPYVSLPVQPVVLPDVAAHCQPTNISLFVTPSNIQPGTSYVHDVSSLLSNLQPKGEQVTSKLPSLPRETTPYIVSCKPALPLQSTQNVSYVIMPPSAQNNVTMGYVHRGDA